MADYAPPSGPPPPKVPQGWKAVWNDQYKEWFYVNIYTKKSQWDKPTEPIYPPEDAPPEGPPPTYDHGAAKPAAAEKTGLSSNNPYARGNAGSSHDLSEDERLARQLQAEENARASSRGAADSYYNQPGGSQPGYEKPGYGQPSYGQQELPPRTDDRSSKKGGFLGKLLGKASSSHSQQPQYGGYPQPGPYQAGPPQGAYGYAPQQGYYGQGGYPPQQYAQAPARTHGGLGTGGAAALGVGGGLLGGMLLADAIEDHDQGEYQQGYDQGYDQGADNGDFGGGDGGDFGGGDF